MIFDLHNDIILEKNIDYINDFIGNNKVILAICGTHIDEASALKHAKTASKISYVAFEDISCSKNLSALIEYKPFYCSLTWNYNNEYAGGALDDGRLTNKGKYAINLFNENKIPIDLAHLNRKSFFDVIELSDKVLCSHTCFDYINSHKRNLSDEQIKMIIAKKGIIGLTFVSEFLTDKTATYMDIIKHIAYFVDKFGIDSLAIGSDFFGTKPIKKIRKYEDFSILYGELLKIGFTENDVEKIFYINANNFLLNNI